MMISACPSSIGMTMPRVSASQVPPHVNSTWQVVKESIPIPTTDVTDDTDTITMNDRKQSIRHRSALDASLRQTTNESFCRGML